MQLFVLILSFDMKAFFKNIVFQSLIMLLAVQTLNLSVNSIGFYNTLSSTTDNEDYVDSMIEYVIENVLGYSKSTINDMANIDYASKQQQTSLHIDLKWFPNDVLAYDLAEATSLIARFIPQNELLVNLYYKEVPAKPPQV